jgi:hypothetical protein
VRPVIILAVLSPLAFAATPTYYADVEPVLMQHCQSCHRPGEIGPMPLLTYEQARPWAKSIKNAVALKKMPPWFADPGTGHFSNDRSLTPQEISTIAAWADGGAPAGDASAPRPARTFLDGWNIPQPDVVLSMREPFRVPARASLDYQYIVIPTGFTEDKWVTGVEVRPGDRRVVHHVQVFIREPGSRWMLPAKPYVPYAPNPEGRTDVSRLVDASGSNTQTLVIYSPGIPPAEWKRGQAKRIPAGSDLVMQVHYTSAPEDHSDLTRIGLVFADEKPKQNVLTLIAANVSFKIPAMAANYVVRASQPIPNDGYLIRLFPHMHLRGKSMEYRLVDGERSTTLLKVSNYDFAWQLTYDLAEPIPVKRGMRIDVIATFDNSANNPHNPDPSKNVVWGEQSWEEMAQGYFEVAVDAAHTFNSWIRTTPAPVRP